MGNVELEKMMVDKFRLSPEQAMELGKKIDQYIKDFEENHLYKNLYKYMEIELKNTYHVNGIGEKNIKEISRKYIEKDNETVNLEGYYSFVGYILTVIGQITYFIPTPIGTVVTFLLLWSVLNILNGLAMKIVRKSANFIRTFNNNFPGLILLSILACSAINIIEMNMILSMIMVVVINIGVVSLPFIAKRSEKLSFMIR